MSLIELHDIRKTYSLGEIDVPVLKGITLSIEKGEYVALMGASGSGKSTMIQHFNALLLPTSGSVTVDGMDTREKKLRPAIRSCVGMVFQYPDYQLFDETVYKDISFGPKNMKLDNEEVDRRVREAMRLVGLDFDEFAEKSPFELSGGEKRRTALAGIIAMYPKYLVLDEPMAGLDPAGRRAVLDMISGFRKQLGCAVVMVSHSMDDIARSADRVYVLRDGAIFKCGTPSEIFNNADELNEMGLEPPFASRMASALRRRGFDIPRGIYTNEALTECLAAYGKGADHV